MMLDHDAAVDRDHRQQTHLALVACSQADACRRWEHLCERYLPVKTDESVWRSSRKRRPHEPSQGWKLHISATIVEACDLFERVAAFLTAADVQFKAPNSLEELAKLNCGLQYGYHQVGKFITVYPLTEKGAIKLARQLDALTRDFFAVSVPFDEQYRPGSSVFYRYGGFSRTEHTDENGDTFLVIKDPAGAPVPDDRLRPFPDWVADPFPNSGKPSPRTFAGTPLGTTYRVFRAITQRGKGGTYQAVDISDEVKPRLCIVKEGRHNGEVSWNGQDGFRLVKNEFEVLNALRQAYGGVPEVFASFEIHGNMYFAMEYVEGKSLQEMLGPRKRRFSIRKVIHLAVAIAQIIRTIHEAGWVWNDCKPANLIVTPAKSLRPIDFEGAFPTDRQEPFDWKTKGFSRPGKSLADPRSIDLFALGAVIYFLLTGRLYEADSAVPIARLRRSVPRALITITETLLSDPHVTIAQVESGLSEIRTRLRAVKG